MLSICSAKPLLYDLFSGAGGAARGYQRAGFYVVGIDNRPQPRYAGDRFIQMDAFEFFDRVDVGEFPMPALWHASPPCQAYTILGAVHKDKTYPDLIEGVRERLRQTGVHYVIENVVGAPLQNPLLLCGQMFGLRLFRHRLFETSWPMLQPGHTHGRLTAPRTGRRPHSGSNTRPNEGQVWSIFGHFSGVKDAGRELGMEWMNQSEMSQAIPPAFSEFLGKQVMQHLSVRV